MANYDSVCAADLRQLLNCVRELYQQADLDSSPRRFMAAARKLVPSDYAAYEELNRVLGRTAGANDPADVRPKAEQLEAFAHYASRGEHPIIGHWMKHPKQRLRAVSILQVMSRDQYHRSGIYNDVYKYSATEDQAGLRLTGDGPVMVAMAVGRSGTAFSERDRLVLELLQPHLVQAYWNAAELTRLRGEAEASDQAIEAAGTTIVRLDGNGVIIAASAAARHCLDYYGGKRRKQSALPPIISCWIHQKRQCIENLRASQPLVLKRECGSLKIRVAWDRPGIGTLMLLEERTTRKPSPQEQVRAALSPRLRELLGHLLSGEGEKQAAAKMSLSRNTVHNYVTALYRRLDVSSRSELMARYVNQGDDLLT